MKTGGLIVLCFILIVFLILVMNSSLRERFTISKRALGITGRTPRIYMPRYSVKKLRVEKNSEDDLKCPRGLCDPSEYIATPESFNKHSCSRY